MYLQSVSSSDAQTSCYTPKIPEADRVNLMADFKNNPLFTVSFQIDNTYTFTCTNPADCLVAYNVNYTPILYTMEPSHFCVGQPLTLRLTPFSQTWARSN